MSLDVVIGVVGVIVTILVVVGMMLITPRGVETSHLPSRSAADTPAGDDPHVRRPCRPTQHGPDLDGQHSLLGRSLTPTRSPVFQ
jgi:hypothetical protein